MLGIQLKDGFIDLGKEDFLCPVCQHHHDTEDWYDRYNRLNKAIMKFKCKKCKARLELTVDMMSEVHVWQEGQEP